MGWPKVGFSTRKNHGFLRRDPHAPRLAEIILYRQEKDGSWWDYPLYDYHQPYGTGYALMALAWCRDHLGPATEP